MRDLTLSENSAPPKYSTDPSRADYACPAYREMAPRWEFVGDVRAGTPRIRARKEVYLPKFEAETEADWNARVAMTFVEEHYAQTLVDHVGLVFSEPIQLGKDVPPQLVDLIEDIDGEGNHLDVFAAAALEAALHQGHCAILTDFPDLPSDRELPWSPPEGFSRSVTLGQARAAQVRPYATFYAAQDILSWRTETIGGIVAIVRIVLREHAEKADGDFGVKSVERFRELSQDVDYNETGAPVALGAIRWRTFEVVEVGQAPVETDRGTISGPSRLTVRVVYGGEKVGVMRTRPHLAGLAQKTIEEAQVQSDYAAVMHKCNVPTPVFIGRQPSPPGTQSTIKMGQGIDIPTGGDAKMLEPSGNALAATRARLEDIRRAILRNGATTGDASGKTLTATEAAIVAKQRNAKLARAARSLQDALEGMLADMAAFLRLPDGGSLHVNQEFSGQTLDPAYLRVLVDAWKEDGLMLEEVRYALQTGKLPDDMAEMDSALRLIAEAAASNEAETEELEDAA